MGKFIEFVGFVGFVESVEFMEFVGFIELKSQSGIDSYESGDMRW